VVVLAAGTQGYLLAPSNRLEPTALVVGAVLLIATGTMTDVAGLVSVTAIAPRQRAAGPEPRPSVAGADR
jgi:TRAP-type uncharacterized transport system fused permease subunit